MSGIFLALLKDVQSIDGLPAKTPRTKATIVADWLSVELNLVTQQMA